MDGARNKDLEGSAARLIRARESLGLSQSEFAKRAGIGQTTYCNWENGHPVGLAGAMALRQCYRLSLDWIYYGEPAALPTAVWERIQNYRPGSQPVDGRQAKVRSFRRRANDRG